jgi:outer membrane protein assembly factor BamD (BamD/ComL family)
LLSAARTALAAGDTARARRFLAAALRDGPRARQRAMAELLGADALLGESRYDAAVSAYRSTMYRFAAYPEGETAAFALAELLSERGPRAQAEQALTYCLARYPKGRFSDEVEKKLASLRPAQGR